MSIHAHIWNLAMYESRTPPNPAFCLGFLIGGQGWPCMDDPRPPYTLVYTGPWNPPLFLRNHGTIRRCTTILSWVVISTSVSLRRVYCDRCAGAYRL
jgi:hypothetical protein